MKAIDPVLSAHLGARGALAPRVLVWFAARARVSGLPAPWGVWNGDDDRTFTIDGQPRLYWGAGALIDPGVLTSEAGYVVRLHRISIAQFHADVAGALASTDIRMARADLHQVHLQPGSHDLVAAPLRRFRGFVEGLSLPLPAQGATAAAEVQLASAVRSLTIPLDVTKSDATLQAVHPGDLFRRYIAISGSVTTAWGESNGTGGAPAGPVRPPPISDSP